MRLRWIQIFPSHWQQLIRLHLKPATQIRDHIAIRIHYVMSLAGEVQNLVEIHKWFFFGKRRRLSYYHSPLIQGCIHRYIRPASNLLSLNNGREKMCPVSRSRKMTKVLSSCVSKVAYEYIDCNRTHRQWLSLSTRPAAYKNFCETLTIAENIKKPFLIQRLKWTQTLQRGDWRPTLANVTNPSQTRAIDTTISRCNNYIIFQSEQTKTKMFDTATFRFDAIMRVKRKKFQVLCS